MKISLAMIIKNEENHLKRCLDSVGHLVDEMIVVDTGSTDQSTEILKSYEDVSLYHFEWCDDFSKARNYALEQCTGDYILILDADFEIRYGKRIELENIARKNQIGKMKIISTYLQDNEIRESTAYIPYYFPKGIKYIGRIHEQLDSSLERVQMKLTARHSGYLETSKGLRNIPLLHLEVKDNPNDVYYLYQLGKEYRIVKKFDTAYPYLKKAYQLSNKQEGFYPELVVNYIHCGKELGKIEIDGVIKDNVQRLQNIADYYFAAGLYYMELAFHHPAQAINYLPLIEANYLKCLRMSSNRVEYVKGTSTYLAAYNLGVYYEVIGNLAKAKIYYEKAWRKKYSPAYKRLVAISQ